jgi:hypothetical protein
MQTSLYHMQNVSANKKAAASRVQKTFVDHTTISIAREIDPRVRNNPNWETQNEVPYINQMFVMIMARAHWTISRYNPSQVTIYGNFISEWSI